MGRTVETGHTGLSHSGRILLLGTAVVLLIVGVVCLKQRLGYQELPPAFVPGDMPHGAATNSHITHQPTILSTDPSSESGNSMHHPWHDADALPPNNLPPDSGETFPVRNGTPASEPLRPWEEAKPMLAEPPAEPPPVPPEQPGLTVSQAAGEIPPISVITKQDDSLWFISEQAYGDGMYYRALFALNKERIPRPDRIQAGIEVRTPPMEELRQLYPDLCPVSREKQGS